jgi:hypothetical protein
MGRRHCYDLTNDKWISEPRPLVMTTRDYSEPRPDVHWNMAQQDGAFSSGVTPDAGGAADLRQCPDHRADHKPLSVRPLAHSPLRDPSAGGTLALRVFDALLTIAALAMFGTVALFLLVLA